MQKTCFSYGLTSVHDCGISEHQFSLLEKIQDENQAKFKLVGFVILLLPALLSWGAVALSRHRLADLTGH